MGKFRFRNRLQKMCCKIKRQDNCENCEKKLSLCQAGENGKILKIEGSKIFRKRLFELGMINGTEFKIIRNNVTGMIQVVIRNYCLMLRNEEARNILVETY